MPDQGSDKPPLLSRPQIVMPDSNSCAPTVLTFMFARRRQLLLLFFLLYLLPTILLPLNVAKQQPSPEAVVTHQSEVRSTNWTQPRLFLVYNHEIFVIFEDWVNPFLYALGMTLEVNKFSLRPNIQDRTTTLQTALKAGDTVLFLQSIEGMTKKKGVEYWLLNTEGPDKGFAKLALSRGIKRIIDYSSFNVERHTLVGAETSLWLPIIGSHLIRFHNVRDKLCMIGGANTPRRVQFVDDFNAIVHQRGKNVSIHSILGWGNLRNYDSQTCALVVNVASVENNHATPRLRLDTLWQLDVPIISETMSGNETLEYKGTVMFVPLSELPNSTLNLWELGLLEKYAGDASSTKRIEERVTVHESRLDQFQHVVQTVVLRAYNVHACPECLINVV